MLTKLFSGFTCNSSSPTPRSTGRSYGNMRLADLLPASKSCGYVGVVPHPPMIFTKPSSIKRTDIRPSYPASHRNCRMCQAVQHSDRHWWTTVLSATARADKAAYRKLQTSSSNRCSRCLYASRRQWKPQRLSRKGASALRRQCQGKHDRKIHPFIFHHVMRRS